MKLTPGMQQYMEQKDKYPDCVVLFRMGDFYETFYDDAKVCAKVLGITLTARGKGETRAPLAGIPYHALDNYLHKLVKAGYKVALCEQLEDPKKAKGLVKRGVVRIITPGTLMDEKCLDQSKNNYIASVFADDKNYGFAICDISTGEFNTSEFDNADKLICEFAKYNPSEVLVSSELKSIKQYCDANNVYCNVLPITKFWIKSTTNIILEHFKIKDLSPLGLKNHDLSVCASGALLSYLQDTQMTSLNHISKIRYYKQTDYMNLDASTIRNLELTKNIMDGSKRGSLLSVIDKTTTTLGSRLIKKWVTRPLIDVKKINKRLIATKCFFDDAILREDVNVLLKQIADLERLIGRVEYGIANARDLLALRNSLDIIPKLNQVLNEKTQLNDYNNIKELNDLNDVLFRAIKDEPSGSTREGNIIKEGYNSELDELLELKRNGTKVLQDIEQKEKDTTGIPSLKIGYNKVFGYFLEATSKYKDQVPNHYIRKQTLANCERYITQELKEKEELLLSCDEKIVQLENKLFTKLIEQTKEYTQEIQSLAKQVATIDCLLSFAKVSISNNYVYPVVNTSYDIEIENARHAVIETLEENYISNNCNLYTSSNIMIITGPNMSGKSSYMRQTALCTLMAQIGCFVPATSAIIGVVDRIFTRVGAYDDLTSGQSTFMVEMNETANIINNATDKSLIILDEIGRGTSTYDGIAIAWSVVEHIITKIGAKCLFATHYHQMNKLSDIYKNVANFNVVVEEIDDEIIFLHKLVQGGTDKSYGIEVARLAGLPDNLIKSAREVMSRLELEDEIADKISTPIKKKEVALKPQLDKEETKETQMKLM